MDGCNQSNIQNDMCNLFSHVSSIRSNMCHARRLKSCLAARTAVWIDMLPTAMTLRNHPEAKVERTAAHLEERQKAQKKIKTRRPPFATLKQNQKGNVGYTARCER